MNLATRLLLAIVSCLISAVSPSLLGADADPARIPFTLPGGTGAAITLGAAIYRPGTGTPFPLAVVSHGDPRNASARRTMHPDYAVLTAWLVDHGYAVIVLMRRGFGSSDGDFVEGPVGFVLGNKSLESCEPLTVVYPRNFISISFHQVTICQSVYQAIPERLIIILVDERMQRFGEFVRGKYPIKCRVNFNEVAETCLMSQVPQMPLKLFKLTDHIIWLSVRVDHPSTEVHGFREGPRTVDATS